MDERFYTFLRVTHARTGHGLFYGGFGGRPFLPGRVINYYLGNEDGYRAVLARTRPDIELTLLDETGRSAELSTTVIATESLAIRLSAAHLPATSNTYELVASDTTGRRIDATTLVI